MGARGTPCAAPTGTPPAAAGQPAPRGQELRAPVSENSVSGLGVLQRLRGKVVRHAHSNCGNLNPNSVISRDEGWKCALCVHTVKSIPFVGEESLSLQLKYIKVVILLRS